MSQHCYPFPRPSVTVDAVILRPQGDRYALLLIERAKAPFAGQWALPGGFLDMDEDLQTAAQRELQEETGLPITRPMVQVGAYGAVNRDPRGRTITVAYGLVLTEEEAQAPVQGQDDARRAEWHAIDDLPTLAFDHAHVVQDALAILLARKYHGLRAYELENPHLTWFHRAASDSQQGSGELCRKTGTPTYPRPPYGLCQGESLV